MTHRPLSLGLLLVLVVGCERPVPTGPLADSAAALTIRQVLSTGSDTDGGGTSTQQVTGTGWGHLAGQFLFQGTPPARRPLTITKDAKDCAPGGRQVLSDAMLVDSATRGIANVAIYLRKASRTHESAQPTVDEVLFDQRECLFLSHVLVMKVGQTINIKNSDPVGHNTKIDGKQGSSFNQTIPVDQTLTFTPSKEEPLPVSVSCSIHPWMQAYLLPRNDGYFVITAKDGSFELTNLPAGEELEFQVWHEMGTGPGGALKLDTPEAKSLKWSKRGRFRVTLEQEETMTIPPLEVPPEAFKG